MEVKRCREAACSPFFCAYFTRAKLLLSFLFFSIFPLSPRATELGRYGSCFSLFVHLTLSYPQFSLKPVRAELTFSASRAAGRMLSTLQQAIEAIAAITKHLQRPRAANATRSQQERLKAAVRPNLINNMLHNVRRYQFRRYRYWRVQVVTARRLITI